MNIAADKCYCIKKPGDSSPYFVSSGGVKGLVFHAPIIEDIDVSQADYEVTLQVVNLNFFDVACYVQIT